MLQYAFSATFSPVIAIVFRVSHSSIMHMDYSSHESRLNLCLVWYSTILL